MDLRDRLLSRLLRLTALPSRRLLPGYAPLSLRRYGVDATITRDDRGVPWVSASRPADLYFASGFAQACDRLWQMDLLRRRAQGLLSEVFGKSTVEADLYVRRLAISRVAREAEAVLSPDGRAALDSFSSGVNTAIGRLAWRGGLPPEFLLLRYRPAPWCARDCIAIVKMLGFDLGKNLAHEVFRTRLAQEAPRDAQAFLEPKYPADVPLTIPQDASGPAAGPMASDVGSWAASAWAVRASRGGREEEEPPDGQELGCWPLPGGEGPGSNAWVLAGSRTASGLPLLANDPHLAFSQPNLWYQIGLRLAAPLSRTGYGVTVPGLPGLVCGANEHLAFGITNATVDTQDLCVAEPGEPLPGRWTETSVLKVRHGQDVTVTSAGAPGCVETAIPQLPGGPWLLFWSGYQPSAEIDGCLSLWRARSYDEFREGLRHFGVPVLNYLVACADGTIALKTAGRVPRRLRGSGARPASYAEVAASWRGFLDFEELPEVVNPAQGYIVSANNTLVPDDQLHLTVDWAGAYRAPRIHELLRDRDHVTAADCARWQADVMNTRAARLLPVLLPAIAAAGDPLDHLTTACLDLLRDWDGRDRPDLAAPLIFDGLMNELTSDWIGRRLGEDLTAAMPDLPLQVDHLVLNPADRSAIGVRTPLPAAAASALRRTAARLEQRLGSDPGLWRNDAVYLIADSHPLARSVKSLVSLFGRPRSPVGTSHYSVRLMVPGRAGDIAEGAPWRFVAQCDSGGCAMWDALRHGSSGHPLSPHYDDQSAAHDQGRVIEVKPGFGQRPQPRPAPPPASRGPKA